MTKVAIGTFALEYAKSIRSEDPGLGISKIWEIYQKEFRCEHDILGRDAFSTLLTDAHMKVRLKVRKPKTTDSSHGLPTFPNLIKDFIPTAPNQLWVSDITYIEMWLSETQYSFCYLSMIMDAYTKELIGWSVGDSLETIYPLEALKMALKRIEGQEVNLIHHSDRGCQYASADYVGLLREHHVRISMTESGDPKDNAQAERINNTMKNELLKDMKFHDIGQVRVAVAKAADFYNYRRPHMSVNMMTPSQAFLCSGELDKKWRSYREEAIKAKMESIPEELVIPKNTLPLLSCQGLTEGRSPSVNP